VKTTDLVDIRQAIQQSGLQDHAQQALDRVTLRLSDLASFAYYAMDHSNDPAVVANAKRVLGIK
jgi:hypothetical protein